MERAHVLREMKSKFEANLSEMNEPRSWLSPKVWASARIFRECPVGAVELFSQEYVPLRQLRLAPLRCASTRRRSGGKYRQAPFTEEKRLAPGLGQRILGSRLWMRT
jgi:hypothetical protein